MDDRYTLPAHRPQEAVDNDDASAYYITHHNFFPFSTGGARLTRWVAQETIRPTMRAAEDPCRRNAFAAARSASKIRRVSAALSCASCRNCLLPAARPAGALPIRSSLPGPKRRAQTDQVSCRSTDQKLKPFRLTGAGDCHVATSLLFFSSATTVQPELPVAGASALNLRLTWG